MLKALVYPLPIALALIVLATAMFWLGRRKFATFFIAIAAGGLYLLSTPAVAGLLIGSLEHGFEPRPVDAYKPADAIVVLGGGIMPRVDPQRTSNLLDSADRIRTGAHLYHAGKAPLVITTGARPYPDIGPSAAEAAAGLLQEFGVPADAILAPGRSMSTREDALSVRAIIEREDLESVLLVTSAYHLPRALATFDEVGVEVRPVPADYMTADITMPGAWLPDDDAFDRSNSAWHEYAGRLYYRLRGWI